MTLFIKKFKEWFTVKSQLDKVNFKPPLFHEREIWWCSIGENVGTEISGKGTYFRRPILILRKLDRYSFIGIPITRSVRIGSWYEHIVIDGKSNTAILSQPRHMDYRRMENHMCTLLDDDFSRIRNSFLKLIALK